MAQDHEQREFNQISVQVDFLNAPVTLEVVQLAIDLRHSLERYLDGETSENTVREEIRQFDEWFRSGPEIKG